MEKKIEKESQIRSEQFYFLRNCCDYGANELGSLSSDMVD
jgi:hypothetical protein